MSNLRPAPMFLRPSMVRQLIRDTAEIRKGVEHLQMLALPLVDQPKPSAVVAEVPAEEITRFDSGHEAASNAEIADPVEADATGGDSEPGPVDLQLTKPESEPVQSPFTCNGAALDWPDAPLPEHADPDLDRPEPTPADEDHAAPSESMAVEPRQIETLRNLGRRRDKAEQPRPQAATQRAEVIRAVAKKLEARKAAPAIDWARVAAAHRNHQTKNAARPKPTRPAPSRDECPHCGIPGWRGCDHFLPCEEAPRLPPSTAEKMKGARMGRRHREGV